MKRLTLTVALLAVVAGAAFLALPTTATVDSTADLGQIVRGDDGIAAQQSGCTRVTNRFCVLDTRDNCRACR
jgi:hypothetical protein